MKIKNIIIVLFLCILFTVETKAELVDNKTTNTEKVKDTVKSNFTTDEVAELKELIKRNNATATEVVELKKIIKQHNAITNEVAELKEVIKQHNATIEKLKAINTEHINIESNAIKTIDSQDRFMSKFGIFLSMLGLILSVVFVLIGLTSYRGLKDIKKVMTDYEGSVKDTYNILKWDDSKAELNRSILEITEDKLNNAPFGNWLNKTSNHDLDKYETKIIDIFKENDNCYDANVLLSILSTYLNLDLSNRAIPDFLVGQICSPRTCNKDSLKIISTSYETNLKYGLSEKVAAEVKIIRESYKKKIGFEDQVDTNIKKVQSKEISLYDFLLMYFIESSKMFMQETTIKKILSSDILLDEELLSQCISSSKFIIYILHEIPQEVLDKMISNGKSLNSPILTNSIKVLEDTIKVRNIE